MSYLVRMRFSKLRRAKYISHLDLIRCFQRTVCRADLPAAYSNGYHPHMQTSFAVTLPLGFTSTSEILELGLTEELPFEEVKERLNTALPADIRIEEAGEPKTAFRDLAFSDYLVELPCENPSQLHRSFDTFVAQPEILIEKRTKKGMREVDLKPMIQVLAVEEQTDKAILSLRLPAGSSSSLNPMLLLEALRKYGETDFGTPSVCRTALLTAENAKFF